MANPNPSPSTRFGAANGNPIGKGKSSKQREAEYRAAEKAAILRDRMLSYIAESTEGDDAALLEHLDANTLKLIKDSEDRAHGTPKQSTEISGPEGAPIQTEEVGKASAKLTSAIEAIAERSRAASGTQS